jgi:hypothetical protein
MLYEIPQYRKSVFYTDNDMKKIQRYAFLGLITMGQWACQSKTDIMGKTESEAERAAAYSAFPDALYPVRVKGKWGYMNRKTEMVILPSFLSADDFHEGLAVVSAEENGKSLYGYIDLHGQWVIAPKYHQAGLFQDNRAPVQVEDQFGYIDRTGKVVIPLQFEDAGPFAENRAAIKKNGWTGFIDSIGQIVIEPHFTCSVQHPVFSKGMAPVFGADEMTGFINPHGEWIIEPKFESAGPFREDKAWAMIKHEDSLAPQGFTIRGGYINRKGEYGIQPEYEFGWDFYEGYAAVWKLSDDGHQKLWSVLDSTGQPVLQDLTYRNVGALTSGLIPIQDENMAWGFINLKGEEIIKPQYTGINRFMNGLARMETGSAFDPRPVYINLKGEVVWK